MRVYDGDNGTVSYEDNTTGDFDKGLKTTGLAVGKHGVYLVGYGESTTTPQTSWVVKAYELNLAPSWQRVFGGLNEGTFAKALDIAMGAKAVIAVGQVQNGFAGPNITGVEAYTP